MLHILDVPVDIYGLFLSSTLKQSRNVFRTAYLNTLSTKRKEKEKSDLKKIMSETSPDLKKDITVIIQEV